MPENDIIVRNIGEMMATLEKIDREQTKKLEAKYGKNMRELQKTMWFRGHGDKSWKTIPSVQREENYSPRLERELVNRFRIRAAQILDNAPAKNNFSGWMSLMQHYGLATRLMDWSKSPLIAAYFATEKDLDHKKEDGSTVPADACIWILWPSLLNQDQIHTDYVYPCDSISVERMLVNAFKDQHYGRRRNDPQTYDAEKYSSRGKIVACEPVEHDLRMYSQQACFTVHDYLEGLDEEEQKTITQPTLHAIASDVKYKDDLYLTRRLIIPAKDKETFRNELRRLGITKSFIYPDMDHLSAEIKADMLPKE